MLDWGSGCHVGSVDVFSNGEGEILPLYKANLTAEVTVANMVSKPKGVPNDSNKSAISVDERELFLCFFRQNKMKIKLN